MVKEIPQYSPKFDSQAKGFAIGEGNIIYNYFGYSREEIIKTPPDDSNDDNLLCPYRGLYHFTPDDTEYFFGRKIFIDKLFQATQKRNFIPVLGASGSGKSSVVLAGLVPKLEQEGNWKFTHFRPSNGNNPFYALAKALIPLYRSELDSTDEIVQAKKLGEYFQSGEITLTEVLSNIQQKQNCPKLLIIADQFEELYTQYADNLKLQHQFLDCLLTGFPSHNSPSESYPVLVMTMRADFLNNALAYRPLADMMEDTDIKLGAMSQAELTEVIEKPAEKLGVKFETGLVERILNDLEDKRENLPLLEFALTELWEKRQGKQLTHGGYNAIGEVKGALAEYADQKYHNLTPEEQQKTRYIFLQLVHIGEGTDYTRRVVTKKELGADYGGFVHKLANLRLVVTNQNIDKQETVEVVHEALIRNWDLLQDWLTESKEMLRQQRQWQDLAKQWQQHPQPDYLLRGRRLRDAMEFRDKQEAEYPLNQETKEFIDKSLKQRNRNRIKIFVLSAIIPTIIIGIASYFGYREIIIQSDLNLLRECPKLTENKKERKYMNCEGRINALEALTKAKRLPENINLQNANLSGANVINANLMNANLENANLSYANLENAQLNGGNLKNPKDAKTRVYSYFDSRTNNYVREKAIITMDLRKWDLLENV